MDSQLSGLIGKDKLQQPNGKLLGGAQNDAWMFLYAFIMLLMMQERVLLFLMQRSMCKIQVQKALHSLLAERAAKYYFIRTVLHQFILWEYANYHKQRISTATASTFQQLKIS